MLENVYLHEQRIASCAEFSVHVAAFACGEDGGVGGNSWIGTGTGDVCSGSGGEANGDTGEDSDVGGGSECGSGGEDGSGESSVSNTYTSATSR